MIPREREPRPQHGVIVTNASRLDYTNYFPDVNTAAKFCANSQQHAWRLKWPIEKHIQARLEGMRGAEELVIGMGGREGRVPRGADRQGISVSTNYRDKLDLIIPIAPLYLDRIFDRGLIWVKLGDPEQVQLLAALQERHGASAQQLVERMQLSERRVYQIIQSIMTGKFEPQEELLY